MKTDVIPGISDHDIVYAEINTIQWLITKTKKNPAILKGKIGLHERRYGFVTSQNTIGNTGEKYRYQHNMEYFQRRP